VGQFSTGAGGPVFRRRRQARFSESEAKTSTRPSDGLAHAKRCNRGYSTLEQRQPVFASPHADEFGDTGVAEASHDALERIRRVPAVERRAVAD